MIPRAYRNDFAWRGPDRSLLDVLAALLEHIRADATRFPVNWIEALPHTGIIHWSRYYSFIPSILRTAYRPRVGIPLGANSLVNAFLQIYVHRLAFLLLLPGGPTFVAPEPKTQLKYSPNRVQPHFLCLCLEHKHSLNE